MVLGQRKNIQISVKQLLGKNKYKEALYLLKEEASYEDDYIYQAFYSQVAKKIQVSDLELKTIRIAFLAGTTVDQFVDNLRFWLMLEGWFLEAYIAPYNTWNQEVIDGQSQLYQFKPNITWFFLTKKDLNITAKLGIEKATEQSIIDDKVGSVVSLLNRVIAKMPVQLMINNIEDSTARVFGNADSHLGGTEASMIQAFNAALTRNVPEGTILFDIRYLSSFCGLNKWEDERLWYSSKQPFSFEVIGLVAYRASKLITAAKGGAKKCIVLDLDNTLWGGIVGDDGVDNIQIGMNGGAVGEAYVDFQKYLKKLSERGIALAICSKNEENIAKEVFIKRKEMILKWDDFVVKRVGWQNKADQLRAIADELNIGLDSLVFVDDNPAERRLIGYEIPEIAVPEMPKDPSLYVKTLANESLFETLYFSEEDKHRATLYHQNAQRKKAQKKSTDIQSYLRSLQMKASCHVIDKKNIVRLTQLINKTNQFNMTGTRYSQQQLENMLKDSNVWARCFSLKDCFGDHGIISGVIVKIEEKIAVVDTWVMSCRVFSRRMEEYIFSVICKEAQKNQCSSLVGKYVKTKKNNVIAKLYDQLGGRKKQENSENWLFDLNEKNISVPDVIEVCSE